MAGKDFFKKRRSVQDKLGQLSENASEEEKRVVETALLKPDKLKKYSGEEPKHKSALDALSVNIVFSNKEEMDLVRRFMVISENSRHEQYITNIDFLLDLLRKIEAPDVGPDQTPLISQEDEKCACGNPVYRSDLIIGEAKFKYCAICLDKLELGVPKEFGAAPKGIKRRKV